MKSINTILIRILVVGLAFAVCGCTSKVEPPKPTKPPQITSINDRSQPPQNNAPVDPPPKTLLDEQDQKDLNSPDLKTRLEIVKKLAKSKTPESTKIIIGAVRKGERELPNQLNLTEDNVESIEWKLSYLSVVLRKLRSLDSPEGNKEVTEFMQRFRSKYENTEYGQHAMKTFDAEIKNGEWEAQQPDIPPDPSISWP